MGSAAVFLYAMVMNTHNMAHMDHHNSGMMQHHKSKFMDHHNDEGMQHHKSRTMHQHTGNHMAKAVAATKVDAAVKGLPAGVKVFSVTGFVGGGDEREDITATVRTA